MQEFKTVGRYGFAVAIWAFIIWIVLSPKRLIITTIIALILLFSFAITLDSTGDTHYVNVHKLELLDKPFGKVNRVLIMNDTVRLVREIGDEWIVVSIGADTLYFQDSNMKDFEDLGYIWFKIQETPFTKIKALTNQFVTINHPNGFVEIDNTLLKNGDKYRVISVNELSNQVILDFDNKKLKLDIDYITTDLNAISKKFPRAW